MAESWTVFILGWYATLFQVPFRSMSYDEKLTGDIYNTQVSVLQLDPTLSPLLSRSPANTGREDSISDLCRPIFRASRT